MVADRFSKDDSEFALKEDKWAVVGKGECEFDERCEDSGRQADRGLGAQTPTDVLVYIIEDARGLHRQPLNKPTFVTMHPIQKQLIHI